MRNITVAKSPYC